MQKLCDSKTVRAGKKCYAVLRSREVRSWKLGENQAKCQHLFCRIAYVISWIFSLPVSGEVSRAIEAREAGRHYLLQTFRFWKTVRCSPELWAQAQLRFRRHLGEVSEGTLLTQDCCLPTSDQGPAFHCAGHRTRLHGRRLSGRSPLQYLKWMERFAPSWRGWMQRTVRIW